MSRMAVVAATLLLCCLGTVGCQDNRLADAEKRYKDLELKHSKLQQDYAECTAKNSDLLMQLQGKDAEMADLKRRSSTPVRPGPGPTSPTDTNKPKAPAGWQETATGAKITLAHDILFPPGKAGLTGEGQRKLKEVAGQVRSTYPGYQVRVYGFTDSDPIVKSAKLWEDNLELSANRAMTVTRELTKDGIAADRIETVAMGATHPVAANTDRGGKAKNRRVEIVVVK